MNTKRGEQPAHAQSVAVGPGGDMYTSCDFAEQHGMTIREKFAMTAMQGLCANSIPGAQHRPGNLAAEAVAYADALLEELERTK